MEEEIEFLEKRIELNKQMYLEFGKLLNLNDETVTAVQNLINKYKELEKERDGIYADYQDLGKEKLEQEKMIELMAKDIAENKLDEDICSKVRSPEKEECDCYADMYDACYGCVIEYYEKKAKGE